MISTKDLVVQFGGVRPIDGLSVALNASVAGLIGPNGAGKTTLLNVISGFVVPATGDVLLDGKSICALSPAQRVRAGLRRTFQNEQVVDDLTVFDNIAALADHVVPRNARRQAIIDVLGFADLAEISDQMGSRLNLFQRRLLEVAKCTLGTPTLILLDEPAAGLSNEESGILREHILKLPDYTGAQTVVIDHDVDLIRSMCSETLVLDYGKMLAVGPTAEVLARDDVRQAYLGEL